MAKSLKQSWQMKSGAVWRHAGFALYQVTSVQSPLFCVERFSCAEPALESAERHGKGFAVFAVYESQLGVLRAFGLIRRGDLPISIVDETGGADPWAPGARGRSFMRSRHPIFTGADISGAALVVSVSNIVAGPEAVRAQLGELRGGDRSEGKRQNIAVCSDPPGRSRDVAAERAGFGNAETLRQASTVVKLGAPAVIDKMDAGEIAIAPAAQIAKQPPEAHSKIVAMPAPSTARVVAIQGRAAALAKALGEVLSESGRCQGPAGAERHERQRRCDAD